MGEAYSLTSDGRNIHSLVGERTALVTWLNNLTRPPAYRGSALQPTIADVVERIRSLDARITLLGLMDPAPTATAGKAPLVPAPGAGYHPGEEA